MSASSCRNISSHVLFYDGASPDYNYGVFQTTLSRLFVKRTAHFSVTASKGAQAQLRSNTWVYGKPNSFHTHSSPTHHGGEKTQQRHSQREDGKGARQLSEQLQRLCASPQTTARPELHKNCAITHSTSLSLPSGISLWSPQIASVTHTPAPLGCHLSLFPIVPSSLGWASWEGAAGLETSTLLSKGLKSSKLTVLYFFLSLSFTALKILFSFFP